MYSDLGCQFTGYHWQTFLRDHNFINSMSLRGNCNENAVAESFFQLLKREQIRRQTYSPRQDARLTCSTTSRCFTTPKRHHNTVGEVSPVEFERRHAQGVGSVWGTRGDYLMKSACTVAVSEARDMRGCTAAVPNLQQSRYADGSGRYWLRYVSV